MPGDVAREPEEEAPQHRRPEPLRDPMAHEVRRPRGERGGEQHQDVQRDERPEQQLQRVGRDPQARDERDPREVQARGREHVRREQRRMSVQQRPRRPREAPPIQPRICPAISDVSSRDRAADRRQPDQARQPQIQEEGEEPLPRGARLASAVRDRPALRARVGRRFVLGHRRMVAADAEADARIGRRPQRAQIHNRESYDGFVRKALHLMFGGSTRFVWSSLRSHCSSRADRSSPAGSTTAASLAGRSCSSVSRSERVRADSLSSSR